MEKNPRYGYMEVILFPLSVVVSEIQVVILQYFCAMRLGLAKDC